MLYEAKLMKAVVYRTANGIVAEEISLPQIDDNQVLVKVANTGFCGSDHSMIKSGGLLDGTILGHETSGTVVEIGKNVQGVRHAMRAMIRPTFCGECIDCKSGRTYFCQNNRRTIGIGDLPGAFAEYVAVYPQMLIPVPDGVDSRNAALAEAFAASLHAINCVGKKKGSVLVTGGGPIGLALVKLLKLLDFGSVILSEPIEAKRNLGLTLGADQAVDPNSQDINQIAFQQTKGKGFDTVFECSGVTELIQQCLNSAARGGSVCMVSMSFQETAITPMTFNLKEVWLTGSYSNTHEENIQCLEWMAAGKLDGRPLITDSVSLDDLPGIYEKRIETGLAVKVMLEIGEEF
jgi:(R,R)-butanediol dehydrogenase/meso-butanediol dehydrogenase/diacetyl reductase